MAQQDDEKREAGYGGCQAPQKPEPATFPSPEPLQTDRTDKQERLKHLKALEEAARKKGQVLRHLHEEVLALEREIVSESTDPTVKP